MEESKKIKLSLGNVSLNYELGSYYIDMRPAIIHYEENLYGGGFDPSGVPMNKSDNGKIYYYPITIAQYCFILHAKWIENNDDNILKQLLICIKNLDNLKTINNNTCVWYHHQIQENYKIPPPWASAMAQGEIISLYLRMYQILKDESFLNTAIQAYNYLKIDFKNGGVRRIDDNGDLWFEEYPSDPPSYVLNGFIYTIFGLYDLFRITKDLDVKKDIDSCIITLKKNLYKYDSGYWSYYDLQKKELVRYYYQQNAHIPQLEILYKLTNELIFEKYRKKWLKTLNPYNYIFVQIMYRIKPRINKIKKIFK